MTEYRISWEIEVDAESVEDAARMATEAFEDPYSTARVFEVSRRTADGGFEFAALIDLLEGR